VNPVRIATRQSDLALWQARHVASRIGAELGRECELVPLTTTGDRLSDVSLAKVGGKGLFVKEIEQALLDGRADIAVHSAKDLPGVSPPELGFAAFPERADPRDALVSRAGVVFDALPQGARIGTGSVRRAAQLRRARPDVAIVALRGNVPTRLAKLESEGLDAVILACAGLDRLELADRITERIDPDRLLPAVGQGVLAIQCRRDDPLGARLASLSDPDTETCIRVERACQACLGADCDVPLGAHAIVDEAGRVRFRARLLDADGKTLIEREASTDRADAEALGRGVAEQLLVSGGTELLARLRKELPA
jgi:hydroxymethylbilane synthase